MSSSESSSLYDTSSSDDVVSSTEQSSSENSPVPSVPSSPRSAAPTDPLDSVHLPDAEFDPFGGLSVTPSSSEDEVSSEPSLSSSKPSLSSSKLQCSMFSFGSDVSSSDQWLLRTPPYLAAPIESIDEAAGNVITSVRRNRRQVQALKAALLGTGASDRPELPEDVVTKILDMAQYWCTIDKRGEMPFMHYSTRPELFLKLGPIPGTVKKLTVSYQTDCESAVAEVGVRDADGLRVADSDLWDAVDCAGPPFRNDVDDIYKSPFLTWEMELESDHPFLKEISEGSTLELTFHVGERSAVAFIRDIWFNLSYAPS